MFAHFLTDSSRNVERPSILSAGGNGMTWTSTKRQLRVAAGVFAVLSVTLCGACGHHTGRASVNSASRVSSPASSAVAIAEPGLSASQTSLITAALTSTDPATVEKALSPAVRAAYEKNAFTLLPAGSSVVIDSSKLNASNDSATVPATVTGGPAAGQWLLLLQRVNGNWLLFGTRKQ